ncbi:CapA family protein [Kribbella deserti]|uniref:CapA family protein n=1 Tax=Kribbella deserti TaxID=1926257 RepID=A0ABV6QW46_9ACTN
MRTPSRRITRSGLVLSALVVLAMGLSACQDVTSSGPADSPKPPASSPSGSPTNTPQPPPGGADRLTLVATGDVLLHERLWRTAQVDGKGRYDFEPLMAPIKPLVESADLAVCHLETPLAEPGGPYSGYPLFNGPPQIAPALKATGYDACTTASNHSFDRGARGVDRTLATLEKAGLRHSGTARTPKEAATPVILDVRGVKVALLSYTYGFNGMPYPQGQTWRAGKLDVPAIKAAARKARDAGAQIVVVSCHWGTEYDQKANPEQRALAPQLLADSNIDLVLGHHAHVVQPMERINGKWVAYGLGNLMAAHRQPLSIKSEGLLARFTFARGDDGRWSVDKAEYASLLVTDSVPMRILDVRRQLAKPDQSAATRRRLEAARARTESVVTSLGAARHGATPITP